MGRLASVRCAAAESRSSPPAYPRGHPRQRAHGRLIGTGRGAGRGSRGYRYEQIQPLEAFIEHNGQREKAARELFRHRHTLRYRIRVEQLGRDLKIARDPLELWLALRAWELVA